MNVVSTYSIWENMFDCSEWQWSHIVPFHVKLNYIYLKPNPIYFAAMKADLRKSSHLL